MAAFERALVEGADGVELDARVCATGEIVIMHDRSLARVTEGADRRDVAEVPLTDLPRVGGERIPTLAEALTLFRGKLVNVEVKADVPSRSDTVRHVAQALSAISGVELLVSSFDPRVVLGFAELLPRVRRGMLIGQRTPQVATLLPRAMRMLAGVTAAHLEDPLMTTERAARLLRAGLDLVSWTVNDASRAKALVALGVETLITDRPADILGGLSM